MKIAIFGRARYVAYIPERWDPAWSVWALPWCTPPGVIARYFDIHARHHRARYGGSRYEDVLAELSPLTMLHDPLPHADEYPLAAVKALVGDGVLTSSIAYMFALAILEAPEEIGLWGVDMTMTDEYRRQRPAIHYLLGLARGRGITVTLPPGCPLFPNAPDYGA